MAPEVTALDPDGFNDFYSNLQALAVATTRGALAMPADVAFHRSLNASFARDLESVEGRVLGLTTKLLELAAAGGSATINSKDTRRVGNKLEDEEDVLDNFHSVVVDAMDQLLERTVSLPFVIPRTCLYLEIGHMSR